MPIQSKSLPRQISIRWLRSFISVAHSGSVHQAATDLGLSVSTVSHQIKSLEDHLGTELLDHTRRPMRLTTRGRVYMQYATEALALLDRARGEIVADQPSILRHLHIAMIDDFENDLAPDVTQLVTTMLPECQLTSYTRPSHNILDLLSSRSLDFGIATQPQNPLTNVKETPFLKDPFLLAVPQSATHTAEAFVSGTSELPFLTYNKDQIMGKLIDAQLTRLRLNLSPLCEFDSTPSMLALVAQGHGWAITTPTNYSRSERFHRAIKLLPFPYKSFARTISMFVAEPHAQTVADNVVAVMRDRLADDVIAPVLARHPWLTDTFRLIE